MFSLTRAYLVQVGKSQQLKNIALELDVYKPQSEVFAGAYLEGVCLLAGVGSIYTSGADLHEQIEFLRHWQLDISLGTCFILKKRARSKEMTLAQGCRRRAARQEDREGARKSWNGANAICQSLVYGCKGAQASGR